MNTIKSIFSRVAASDTRLLGLCAVSVFTLLLSPLAKADARGEQLYRNCVICHGDKAEGNAEQLAPSLSALSEKYIIDQLKKFKGGVRGAHPDDVAGLRMLPMAQTMVTEDDMKTVAAYIVSFDPVVQEDKLEGGNAEAGGGIYNAMCLSCHGPDGKGNDVMNSPSLLYQHDWYHATQLKNFKAGVRGANPQDITGATMRGMSMTLVDEQAILNVVAYIQSLSKK